MKKNNIDLIKDFIISVLILACIILVICVIFYDKLALSKVIPESEDYMLSDEMQEDLAPETLENNTQIVTTYYIDAADLKKYEKTKEYNKGKKNPFAIESETGGSNNVVNGNNTTQDPSNNNSTNFYNDDGTK